MSAAKLGASAVIALGVLLAGTGNFHMQAASPVGMRAGAPRPVSSLAQVTSQSVAASSALVQPGELFSRYCFTCHNQRSKVANLMLDGLDLQNIGEHAAVWEKVVKKLRAGDMPPAGSPRPDRATYDRMASFLEDELDRTAAAHPRPGRPVVQRLNRYEYTNAIRELLALEIDGRAMLPADESGYGFDNIADVLSVTPALLERYMLAASKISRLAVGDATVGPTVETYRVAAYRQQDERMSEDLPFGSVGGTAIRHYFPFDGEYTLRIGLIRNFGVNRISGLDRRERIDVRLDGAKITEFQVGGECVGSKEPRCLVPPGLSQVSEYGARADDGLIVRFPAKAGMRVLGVSLVNTQFPAAPEGAGPDRRATERDGRFAFLDSPYMGVAFLTVEGPFNLQGSPATPSRRQIFVCQPKSISEEPACAREVLTRLARRAFRRPVTDKDLQRLLGLYEKGRANGPFESGIQVALEGLLVSPDFLLRVETPPSNARPNTAYRISDLELASRLSFFLWSSLPDEELLALAADGKLGRPDVLEQQVRRMLADARAISLVNNFASQWLYLRDLRAASPDTNLYPEFNENMRDAFQRETELYLESQLHDDRPLPELLSANYTFVNERLARFYGIPNVYGPHFRRVTVTDPDRIGLLGHGSLLTVTSYATRTSPVIRGKFVLDNLLGSPPPAPPPNVPDLQQAGAGGEPLTTVRARLEAHRKNPTCAGCHARMDPIGFALEKFSAIGKYRTTEFGVPIDSAGVLPDGSRIDGPAQLREVLLRRRGEFVTKVTERLMTYALGRGVEYSDLPAIRTIVRAAAPGDYRWSALITGVVSSVPFQMRYVEARETRAAADRTSAPQVGRP